VFKKLPFGKLALQSSFYLSEDAAKELNPTFKKITFDAARSQSDTQVVAGARATDISRPTLVWCVTTPETEHNLAIQALGKAGIT